MRKVPVIEKEPALNSFLSQLNNRQVALNKGAPSPSRIISWFTWDMRSVQSLIVNVGWY